MTLSTNRRYALLAVSLFSVAASCAPLPDSAAITTPVEDIADKRPYIFTQQHNNVKGQRVKAGWPLQVQLPGNPSVWSFDAARSVNVEPRGQAMVFSPERIAGTTSIFIFDFAISAGAQPDDTGMITITSANPPESLNHVIPNGVYQIEFVIDAP